MDEFINSVDLSGYTQRGDPRPVKLTRGGGNGKVLITIPTGGKEKRDVDVVVKVQELADAARKLGAK